VSNIHDYLYVGQTVICSVSDISSEGRIQVSLKNSQLLPASNLVRHEILYMKTLFQDNFTMQEMACEKTKNPVMNLYNIGSIVEGIVDQILPCGVAIKLSKGVSGLIAKTDVDLTVGDSIFCQILDIDLVSKILDLKHVSLKKDINLLKQHKKVPF
jgi:ribosomal protein S1